MRQSLLIAVVLLLRGFNPATASIIAYYDEPSFVASVPIVSTETFDEFAADTTFGSSVTIDSILYEALPDDEGREPTWVAADGPGVPGYVSPPNGFYSDVVGDTIMTFGPERYVEGIGFWLMTGVVFPVPHWEILIEETDGYTALLDVSFTADNRYYGFGSTVGIRQLTVRDHAGTEGSVNWSFDDVSRTAIIPEPTTIAMLAIAMWPVITRSRRHIRASMFSELS
ncbi:MAG: PEP-CTERM sorting domain-containing protein [Planctomycetes bacterium]|nr:PEP-CTERM sorting domain-containing protein [Planctomycetota bacterium]